MRQERRTARPIANELLRQERGRRGWSRAYIAEEIGVADPKTIGRWERGEAFPSAYFLQKLCTLFAMPAEELGLWQRERRPETDESSPTYFIRQSVPQTEMYLCDPALPPAPTESLVGRSRLLAQIKARLRQRHGQDVVALQGWPGVGKTALAIHLAHDSELRSLFGNGILWACLGPDADLLDELQRWGRLLGISADLLAHPESVEDWSRAIHARIAERGLLLIIDDAWTCQDALAFKIGGPNCAYLLTTRIPAVAQYFTEARELSVDQLSEQESLQLLARFVPTLVAQEDAALCELVHLAGGLPLALELIGTHLRMHVHSGQPRRWRAALERLRQPAARLQLTMPRSPLERSLGRPAHSPISLGSEIELSYQRLLPAARLALEGLASLLTDGEAFSEMEALALSGVTLEALDSLLDAGLLASAGQGRYTVHQTIADFAGSQEAMACNKEEMPPQLSVLRRLRGSGTYTPDLQEHPAYTSAEDVPALAQGPPGETVSL